MDKRRRIAPLICGFVALFCVWTLGHTWTISWPLLAEADFRG